MDGDIGRRVPGNGSVFWFRGAPRRCPGAAVSAPGSAPAADAGGVVHQVPLLGPSRGHLELFGFEGHHRGSIPFAVLAEFARRTEELDLHLRCLARRCGAARRKLPPANPGAGCRAGD